MNHFLRAIGGCALALVMLVGCATSPSPLTPAQKTDRLATVLKISTASAVTLTLNDRNPDARAKVILARDAVNALVANDTVDPQSIVASLSPLWKDAKPEVQLAANTALALLEVYFGDYVVNLPDSEGKANAVKFLKAVVAGIDQGLASSPAPSK